MTKAQAKTQKMEWEAAVAEYEAANKASYAAETVGGFFAPVNAKRSLGIARAHARQAAAAAVLRALAPQVAAAR